MDNAGANSLHYPMEGDGMHDRPRDPAQLAHFVGQIATGELPNDKDEVLDPPELTAKQRAAYARAASLTPERRREIAQKARASRA